MSLNFSDLGSNKLQHSFSSPSSFTVHIEDPESHLQSSPETSDSRQEPPTVPSTYKTLSPSSTVRTSTQLQIYLCVVFVLPKTGTSIPSWIRYASPLPNVEPPLTWTTNVVKWGTPTLIPNTDEPSPNHKMFFMVTGIPPFNYCPLRSKSWKLPSWPAPKQLYALSKVLNERRRPPLVETTWHKETAAAVTH